MAYKYKKRELLQHVRCPECGAPMVSREGHTGGFYGCSRFPLCVGTRGQEPGELDSYTRLLRTAYAKALLFLNSPQQLGLEQAAFWMATKTMDREPSEEEWSKYSINNVPNEWLERAVDAAGDYATEKLGTTTDFLVMAHEERYAAIRGKLRYVTDPGQIRRMPQAEFTRRYDTSDIAQFEALITKDWQPGGHNCPRCGCWSAPMVDGQRIVREVKLEDLFEPDENIDDEEKTWDCGRCGPFTRSKTRTGQLRFVFKEDQS